MNTDIKKMFWAKTSPSYEGRGAVGGHSAFLWHTISPHKEVKNNNNNTNHITYTHFKRHLSTHNYHNRLQLHLTERNIFNLNDIKQHTYFQASSPYKCMLARNCNSFDVYTVIITRHIPGYLFESVYCIRRWSLHPFNNRKAANCSVDPQQ